MNIKVIQFLFVLMMLSVGQVWAVDADGDGSDAVEEALAGTSDNDATERPYWWRTFNGDSASDFFGGSVSGAGDVNGDGYADVIVGAWGDDNNGFGSGSAQVLSGVDGTILYTFNGDSADDEFGRSVSGAGDVNGDGYADVIVGAWGDDNNGSRSGSARIFNGVDGAILYTFHGDSAENYLGESVNGAGDVNGDGYDDVIVGATGTNSWSGAARVFSGFNGAVLYTFNGGSANDYFGLSVSGAGDVNGDGYDDMIVGAYGNDDNGSNSGLARVFSGVDGAILHTFNGDNAGDWFGTSVSDAGDVNNDGYADVIVGIPRDDNNGAFSGSARIFSGVDGAILYTFDGDSADDSFGESVSGAGDVNGDGYDDVIVGADLDDNNGTASGSARILSGIDGSVLYTFNGDSAVDFFGYSVSGAGDVNNDGYADVIVGAYDDDNNGTDSGSARVFLSSDLFNDQNLDYIIDGPPPDTDSDGVPDASDNCPLVANAGQENNDGDAEGDVCDTDDDNDGIQDAIDSCLTADFNLSADNDNDGCDDADEDLDDDNDGYLDINDAFPLDASEWLDTDGDGTGNNADTNDDNDNKLDVEDNCPLVANNSQKDSDNDGAGDVCDAFPNDASETVDGDGDGVGDNADQCDNTATLASDNDNDGCDDATEDGDDDNDGVPDTVDAAPLDNANANEITLPLDSSYKGGQQNSSATAQ